MTSMIAALQRLVTGTSEAAPAKSQRSGHPVISGLYVYPVKSCHAISVQEAAVKPCGLAWDRQWMVVDAATGKFLTQRQEPRLAVIRPSLPPEVLAGAPAAPGAELVLEAPGAEGPLRVPLVPEGKRDVRRVNVWEWTGAAYDEGDAAAAWLAACLGRPVRLVRYIGSSEEGAAGEGGAGDPVVRPTDAEFCRGEVAFPDGYPILLASEESLADLNTRLSSPLPMARFRPNVVVAGAPCAFAEDAWGRVRVAAPAPAAGGAAGGDAEGAAAAAGGEGGGVELEFVRPCDRCGLPSVDQEAGVKKEPNPLDTLSGYRTGKILGWAGARKAWTHASFFATYCQPAPAPGGAGALRVGGAVEVLAERTWEE